MPPRVRLAVCAAGASVAACSGGATSSTGCSATPTPAATPPSAQSGPLSASADRATAQPGDRVQAEVVVSGPARVSAPCTGPVELVVVDVAGLHVHADTPPAAHGVPCGDVTVDPGRTVTYTLTWAPDPTLPPGMYSVVLTLGANPPLVLPVTLTRTRHDACSTS